MQDAPDGLVATNLVKRFGGVTAVDGISLRVGSGEALAIIGPNGAGKSSLLKLLAGEYRPDSGSVELRGRRLDRLAPHLVPRAGIALAHQVPRPFRSMTVRENVAVAAMSAGRVVAGHGAGRLAGGAMRTHIDSVLEECGIHGKAELSAGSLRTLDLKRLGLARALATRPEVILLDEVAAGLVGRELDEAIELIRRIHAGNRTVILVEHVEGVVASLVDRVIVIDWGKLVAEGTPAQIAADPLVRELYLGNAAEAEDATSGHRATVSQRVGLEPAQPLLEVRQVRAGYGSITALREIDLTVGRREFVAVLGANGAGKSTLANAIAGQVSLTGGTMWFEGRDISLLADHQRVARGITLCPEGRRVFSDLTVLENLEIAVPLRTSKAEVGVRFDAVSGIFPQLQQLRGRKAGVLSGGQQQMLAIGRALMNDPKLIICDEISLGLAPVAIDALYEALRDIRRNLDVSVILIEQSVHRSLGIVDRAYVLERGQVAYVGEPAPLHDPHFLEQLYFGASRSVISSL